jgi:hypothetical protein
MKYTFATAKFPPEFIGCSFNDAVLTTFKSSQKTLEHIQPKKLLRVILIGVVSDNNEEN